MIEARAMARELQEQLTSAVKASQEQFRKGQETAASAVRTWTNTAKAVRPHLPRPTMPTAAQLPKLPAVSLPTIADVKQAGAKLREGKLKDVKLPEVRLPKLPAQPLNRITSTDELAEGAERLANRVLVSQLKFAGRTLHNAAPIIADGGAYLTRAAYKVASRVQPATQASAAEPVAEVVETEGAEVVTIADAVELAPSTEASTAEASTAKPRATKASTAKASPAATKPAPAKASSTARKTKTAKK
jgi:hypothetical protein